MAKWKLLKPPTVRQGVGYKCWAAALESWLAVTPTRTSWTQDQLLERRNLYVQPGDPTLPQEGSINAQVFKLMNRDPGLHLNMLIEERPQGAILSDDYFHGLLFENGYLFVVYTTESAGGVRHANVVWAADTEGYVSAMDPMKGTYVNKHGDELRRPLLVAWANKEYVDPWAYIG